MAITHEPVGQIWQDGVPVCRPLSNDPFWRWVGPAILEERYRIQLWCDERNRKFAELLDGMDAEVS